MKKSDIFSIILVASVGMFAAFLVGNAIFGDPNMEKTSFKIVEPISSEIIQPDPELFNREAINPTVEVEVGVCEDSNGNGILDLDERNKCLGVEAEDTKTVESAESVEVEETVTTNRDGDNQSTTTVTEEVVENGSVN